MLKYKEMTLEDIPTMTPLYVKTFNAPPWNDTWTEKTAAKRLSQMIGVPDFYGLCAYDDEGLCGLILGGFEQYCDTVTFNLKEFCVRSTERGRGLGSRIYRELEKRLNERDVSEILLYTLRGMQTQHFYNKQGFNDAEDMVLMKKMAV